MIFALWILSFSRSQSTAAVRASQHDVSDPFETFLWRFCFFVLVWNLVFFRYESVSLVIPLLVVCLGTCLFLFTILDSYWKLTYWVKSSRLYSEMEPVSKHSLKVMSSIFLLFWLLILKENTWETSKSDLFISLKKLFLFLRCSYFRI